MRRGRRAVLAYLDAMHAETLAIFGALTADQLEARCVTPGGAELPVWKWLRATVEHEAHHRGQLHLMLSLIGGTAPPLFGLTEEEVRARSTR